MRSVRVKIRVVDRASGPLRRLWWQFWWLNFLAKRGAITERYD